ncbi:MAG TPA: hypothetical protein VMZ69_08635, partial [Saprospiraceae bacterium]|nr:hypothetical protein [Saprospiraceae bacterium]
MKKHILFAFVAQLILLPCYGQYFNFHSVSPFGIQTIKSDSTRPAQKLMFLDFDGDEDLDLFISGLDHLDNDVSSWEDIHYFIEMQENIGDKWNPQFADRVLVEDFPYPLGYFFPSGGDLNNDGHKDFIVSAIVDYIGNRTATYLQNTGGDQFEVIRFDSMGLPDFVPESFFVPELTDLDSDGDLDILMSGFDPAFAEEDGPDEP